MEFKKLQSDMVAAMKARDKARKDTISSLISAVKKLAIDEGKSIMAQLSRQKSEIFIMN